MILFLLSEADGWQGATPIGKGGSGRASFDTLPVAFTLFAMSARQKEPIEANITASRRRSLGYCSLILTYGTLSAFQAQFPAKLDNKMRFRTPKYSALFSGIIARRAKPETVENLAEMRRGMQRAVSLLCC